MKKILLIAINSKYIHSNLAVYSLKAYAKKYGYEVELAEYTINNYVDEVLIDIYKKKPDFLGFSCYIWNIEMVNKLSKELHKVLKNVPIWYGGPEVSYDADRMLKDCKQVSGVMRGEGEKTFLEIIQEFCGQNKDFSKILGITFRDEKNKIIENEQRPYMDMSDIPFPYEDVSKFENKIIYYETSRGCPYSCSYCMSSVDRCVRFRNIELVKKELKIFIDNKVSQVKFVDRTFNCDRNHTMQIWKFIKENDNGVTNFHFEISADILNEEEISFISTMRPKLIQLEIGVQSTNEETIKAIKRTMKFNKLAVIVNKIKQKGNIHQHLDLIAGLPYEDYDSFKKSFNDVYALKPEQLQLGFLKVLKGSYMHDTANEYGIVYSSIPPYEVMYTKWLSYDEVIELKLIEEMVEVYYNSTQFTATIDYIEKFFETAFDMYRFMGTYYARNNLNMVGHSRISRYNILLQMFEEMFEEKLDNNSILVINDKKYNKGIELNVIKQLLTHDVYVRENIKTRPLFAKDLSEFKKDINNFYINNNIDGYKEYNSKQVARLTHIEHYDIDVEKTCEKKEAVLKDYFILYTYKNIDNKIFVLERNMVSNDRERENN